MSEELSEEAFCAALAEAGLVLEGAALQAALQGARHLRDQIAQLDGYLALMAAGS